MPAKAVSVSVELPQAVSAQLTALSKRYDLPAAAILEEALATCAARAEEPHARQRLWLISSMQRGNVDISGWQSIESLPDAVLFQLANALDSGYAAKARMICRSWAAQVRVYRSTGWYAYTSR